MSLPICHTIFLYTSVEESCTLLARMEKIHMRRTGSMGIIGAAITLALVSACGPSNTSPHGSTAVPSSVKASIKPPTPSFTPSAALLSTANACRLNMFERQFGGHWTPISTNPPAVIQPWSEQDCSFQNGQQVIKVSTLIDDPEQRCFRFLSEMYKSQGVYYAAGSGPNDSAGPDGFFDNDPSKPGARLFTHYRQVIVILAPIGDPASFQDVIDPSQTMAKTAGAILSVIQARYGE